MGVPLTQSLDLIALSVAELADAIESHHADALGTDHPGISHCRNVRALNQRHPPDYQSLPGVPRGSSSSRDARPLTNADLDGVGIRPAWGVDDRVGR
jgi:hypothetical protein